MVSSLALPYGVTVTDDLRYGHACGLGTGVTEEDMVKERAPAPLEEGSGSRLVLGETLTKGRPGRPSLLGHLHWGRSGHPRDWDQTEPLRKHCLQRVNAPRPCPWVANLPCQSDSFSWKRHHRAHAGEYVLLSSSRT